MNIPIPEIDIVLQRPVLVNIREEDDTLETVSLPRLGTDGLLPWLDEITLERRAAYRLSYANLKLDARQMTDAEFVANNLRGVMRDIAVPAQTPKGIRRVINMSLAMPTAYTQKADELGVPSGPKSPIEPSRQKEIEDALVFNNAFASTLAEKLSTLFNTDETRVRPAQDPKDKALDEAARNFPGATVAVPLPAGGESGPNTPVPAPGMTG